MNKFSSYTKNVMESIKNDAVSEQLNAFGDACKDIANSTKDKLSEIDLPEIKDKFLSLTTCSLPAVLASDVYYEKVLNFLSQTYHVHKENPAVREVMDSLAHVKDYGGASFHRIADGRHSILGAFESVGSELKDIEQFEKIKGVFGHLWADFHSSVGVPLFSFDNYDSFKEFCRSLHLRPDLVLDLFTVNSTELIGSCLTIIPQLFRLDEMESIDFARVASKVGILTAFGQGQFEAVSGVFSLLMLGRSFYLAKLENVSSMELLKESFTEGGFTAASFVMVQATPFPLNFVIPFLIVGIKNKVNEEGFEGAFEHYRSGFDTQFEAIKDRIGDVQFSELSEQVNDFFEGLSKEDAVDLISNWSMKLKT